MAEDYAIFSGKQVDLIWPLSMINIDLMNIWRFPWCNYGQSLVPIELQLFNWVIFCILSLTTWPEMTFDLSMWSMTSLIYECSLDASISHGQLIGCPESDHYLSILVPSEREWWISTENCDTLHGEHACLSKICRFGMLCNDWLSTCIWKLRK